MLTRVGKNRPSKLNVTDDVPTTAAADSPEVPVVPTPRMPMHATDVCVVQQLVEQSAIATKAVTVASVEAKSIPVSVTLAVTEATL